jgi:hypothetical protein
LQEKLKPVRWNNLHVIFEDEHIIVVSKPRGLASMPCESESVTILNAIYHHMLSNRNYSEPERRNVELSLLQVRFRTADNLIETALCDHFGLHVTSCFASATLA